MFANLGAGHWLVLGVVMVLSSLAASCPTRLATLASRCGSSSPSCMSCTRTTGGRETARPAHPVQVERSPPLQVRRHPNQHRRLTVKADPVPGRRSSTRRTPDCATRCLRRGAFEITGPVVEPACNPGGYPYKDGGSVSAAPKLPARAADVAARVDRRSVEALPAMRIATMWAMAIAGTG